jgi:hypothetical protein
MTTTEALNTIKQLSQLPILKLSLAEHQAVQTAIAVLENSLVSKSEKQDADQ